MRGQLSHEAEATGRRVARRKAQGPTEIPDKLYFRIGEVARLCRVQAYVLRFWESEFPQLKPTKSGTGQRLYRRRDVETALKIRRLLYELGYTIPGARQAFHTAGVDAEIAPPERKQPDLPLGTEAAANPSMEVNRLKSELREILGILSSSGARARKLYIRKAEAPLFPEQG